MEVWLVGPGPNAGLYDNRLLRCLAPMRVLMLCVLFLAGGVACQASAVGPTVAPLPTPWPTPTPRIGVDLVTRVPPTPAVLQFTPTPLPAPSPTPTPTPVVYAIQAGDTLWDVAYLHYTTVDQVLALNPALRPEALQIGQPILLPPPATPMWSASGGTPVPPALAVISLRLYRSPVGSGWILGEVANEGTQAVENARVNVILTDRRTGAAQEVAAWVTPGIIPPGERAPFGALAPDLPPLDEAGAETATLTAVVAGGATLTDVGTRYLDLTFAAEQIDRGENRVSLEATVYNVGGESAENILVVAVLYDADGYVSGLGQLVSPDPLPAGEGRPVHFDLTPPGGRVYTYRLLAQGVQAPHQ